MNTKKQTDTNKPLIAFEALITRSLSPENLRNELIEMYFNYSRWLIKSFETDTGPVLIGNVDIRKLLL